MKLVQWVTKSRIPEARCTPMAYMLDHSGQAKLWSLCCLTPRAHAVADTARLGRGFAPPSPLPCLQQPGTAGWAAGHLPGLG
jgi:hypothetical protein